MSIHDAKNKDFTNTSEISNDEFEVINKFIDQFQEFYKQHSFIIADNYRKDFIHVPLKNQHVDYKIDNYKFMEIEFCRQIYYNYKIYIVDLIMWYPIDFPKSLSNNLCIKSLSVIKQEKFHSIDLNTSDSKSSLILFNIMNLFDERKILSPDCAYSDKLYKDDILQEFIENHEWSKISKGIIQDPELINSLFIIREWSDGFLDNYTAEFGTILYHLISFRKNNLNKLNEKDLNGLDKLILRLKNTNLLKIKLSETYKSVDRFYPNHRKSILLKTSISKNRTHISSLYSDVNTRLLEEKRILDNCIMEYKKSTS